MKAIVKQSKLEGTVNAPKSKSILHRYLICKYLSNNFNINTFGFCDDNLITYYALANLAISEKLNMGDSASSFRFLLPISLSLGLNKTFVLGNSLLKRPLGFIIEAFANHGVKIMAKGKEIKTSGKLLPGSFYIDASVSSQLISGLLFALPLLEGDSEIIIVGDLVSKQYVDITIDVLKRFGIVIETTSKGYYIKGNQKYIDTSFDMPGDYSSIAYFNVLNKLGSSIIINGLSDEIKQGDANINLFLSSNELVFDLKNNIDLAPIMAAYLAAIGKDSKIVNINALKYKESNRIDEIIALLDSFSINAKYNETNNGTIVINSGEINWNKSFSSKDHRLLMAGMVLATLVGGTIDGVEYISKSYPNFINDLISVGAKICLID